jgi:HSP20 family protein
MRSRDQGAWMWAEACEILKRAERLHRHFFEPGLAPAHQPVWEPPVDVLETEDAFWIMVALPGVDPHQVEIVIDGGALVVAGVRHIPLPDQSALIHRLEIPHGRFERHIDLPTSRLSLDRRELVDGCLLLGLRKL